MLSKAKMGLLFGSMATVLSLGVLGSAYAADADQAKTNYKVEGKQNFNKMKMGGHAGFFGGVALKENKELLELLGLDADELKEAQKAGKSLAEIAQAQGVDKQDVIDLLVKEQADQLAEAVKAGKLTQEQADKLSENAVERITKQVENAKPGDFGMVRGFGGFGHSEALLKLLGLNADKLKEEQKAGNSLAEIAQAQGVDKQDVIDLLVKEQADQLAEAVTAGKLTQEQADKMNENASERIANMVENAHPGKLGMVRGFGGFGQSEALLKLLGLDADKLKEEQKAGKSLAEIAEAQGVDKQAVIDLLVKEQAEKMAEAVAAGKLTQEQADKLTENASKRVEEQVTNPHQGKERGMGKGFFGFGQSEELLTLLKLDAAGLQEALKEGKSLADVAKEQGVDKEQVIALLQKNHEEMLAKAVEEGKLTQEQADKQLENAKEMAAKMVEGSFKKDRSQEKTKE